MGDSKNLPTVMKRAARTVVLLILLAAALGLAFIGSLALTLSLTDNGRIAANLRDASEHGFLVNRDYPVSAFGHHGHQFDAFTDCVGFSTNLGNQQDTLARRIAESPTVILDGKRGPCIELRAGLDSRQLKTDQSYLRFWHGYQVYFRPLLSLAPFDVVMRITALLFYGALIFFALEINRIFGRWSWVVALAPFFLLSDFLTVPMVGTHALSLACAFFSAALTPFIMRQIRDAEHIALPLFAFAAGAIYNFLCFLLNPPLGAVLISFLYIAARYDGDPRKMPRIAAYGALLGLLYFVGFFAAWLGKWGFASAVLGLGAVRAELATAFGMYSRHDHIFALHFLGATALNIRDWWFFAYVAGGCAIAAGVALTRRDQRATGILMISAMCAVPFILLLGWTEFVARAHSAIHSGFVSRTFLLLGTIPILSAFKLYRLRRMGDPAPRVS